MDILMQLQKHFDPIVAGLDERKRDQEGISTSFLLSVYVLLCSH